MGREGESGEKKILLLMVEPLYQLRVMVQPIMCTVFHASNPVVIAGFLPLVQILVIKQASSTSPP